MGPRNDPDTPQQPDAAEGDASTRLAFSLERVNEKVYELAELTTLFQEFPFGQVDFSLVAQRLAALADAKAAFVNSFEESTNLLRTEAIHIENQHLEAVRKLFGYDPVGSTTPVTDEWKARLWKGRLVRINGIYELMLGRFPALICRQLERLVGVGPIYGIGLTYQGQVLGGAIVIYPAGQDLEVAPVVEVFARTIGNLLLRKRTETALVRESERLATTLRSVGEGIVSTDAGGRIALLNRAAESMLLRSEAELLGAPADEVLGLHGEQQPDADLAPRLVRALLAGESAAERPLRARLYRATRTPLTVLVTGTVMRSSAGQAEGTVLVLRDVTRQERVEDELERVRRLESLGLLAAGIAHEFNNVLQAIVGNLGLARLAAEEGADPREAMAEAEANASRARALTGRLLTFAEGGAPVPADVSVESLLRQAVGEALRNANRTVTLRFRVAPELPAVRADREQISHVLQNLVSNSLEAMPSGGTLAVSAGEVSVGAGEVASLEPGAYVAVTVEDSGAGIPLDVLPQVLEPFGAARPGAAGLGLSIAFSIVKRHGGHLQIESTPGQGTLVRFFLPVAGAARSPRADVRSVAADLALAASPRVLVMDDDERVLKMMDKALRRFGYEVALASDGAEAVAKYQAATRAGAPYALVILDLTVPGGMGGRDTIRELKALDPDVVAVVASGYANDDVMANPAAYGFRDMIAKPYDLATLRNVVERLVGPGRS